MSLALAMSACTNLVVQRAMQKAPVAEVQTSTSSESPRVVAFLGDSLTAGPGLSMKETFPAVIQQKIGGRQLPWIVQNSGVSGDTTTLALSRLNWALKSKPRVLVVALGSNDGLRGLAVDEMERNLRAIITRAQSLSIKVVLVGQQLPHNFPDDYRARFTAVFPRVAREHRVPLVPFMLEGVALDERFVLEDGIHPNADGARKIADNIWPVLSNVLRQSGKSNSVAQ
ncbi:MAG: arylesterase [Betaproteobacteria bacterium]|nr:arylesterase [Betaproteobacteria bacterium]